MSRKKEQRNINIYIYIYISLIRVNEDIIDLNPSKRVDTTGKNVPVFFFFLINNTMHFRHTCTKEGDEFREYIHTPTPKLHMAVGVAKCLCH